MISPGDLREQPLCVIWVGPHHCPTAPLVHPAFEKDGVFSKVLEQTDAFTVAEELQICVGMILCVLAYTGCNNDGKLTCSIVKYYTERGCFGESIKRDDF